MSHHFSLRYDTGLRRCYLPKRRLKRKIEKTVESRNRYWLHVQERAIFNSLGKLCWVETGEEAMRHPTHHDLPKVTEGAICGAIDAADQGKQTAIVSAGGKIRSIVGLSSLRYLPDPDPIDELLQVEQKQQEPTK